jgi:hypothetical protein
MPKIICTSFSVQLSNVVSDFEGCVNYYGKKKGSEKFPDLK